MRAEGDPTELANPDPGRDHPVKVGVTLPQFRPDATILLGAAVAAEDAGLDGVFLFDHLFPPGGSPETPALECFASAGAVAAATSRIDVGTLVVRATLRPVAVTASALRSLARIADGRAIFGIGAGDSRSDAEYSTYGLTPPTKAKRLKALEGLAKTLELDDSPLWVGGLGSEARSIAARHGDAWNLWGTEPGELPGRRAQLEEEASRCGRTSLPHLTWGGLVETSRDHELAETLVALEVAGVEYAVIAPVGIDDKELANAYRAIAALRR